MKNVDESYEVFKKFKADYESYKDKDLSESDTRSKLLDFILIDILGWKEPDIEREGYVKPGYFDYELKTSIFRFVVEAKKKSIEFKLPATGNRVKIKTLKKGNEEVIDQVREYVVKRNLLYGVISNGHQFIIGKFLNTDGTDWESNDCIFYDGLEKIDSNFIEFYNLLSKTAILNNNRIKIVGPDYVGKRISESFKLRNRGEELVRNDLSDQLIPIISDIFSEIYNTENLTDFEKLKKCYVTNEDVQKNNSELNVLFYDNPPSFDGRISKVRNTEHTQEEIKGKILEGNTTTPAPIIIIGSKGAGKTTFIKYFFEIVLNQDVKKNRPIIYIDFRGYTEQQVKDTNAIYSKVLNQLFDVYPNLDLNKLNVLEKIYSKEIKRNKEGIWSSYAFDKDALDKKVSDFLESKINNHYEHLVKIAEYLNNVCRKRLVIIYDNADQLNEESQKEVFLLAQSSKIAFKALIMVSLREGYFLKWREKPPFDAYHSTIFHITAPSYRDVLKKRIQYAVDNFKFVNVKGDLDAKSFKLSESALSNLFKSLYKTLFLETNSQVLKFLEETSYPDIRSGLEKFNKFLISGHTKITAYIADPNYNIPVWEFIKSVALESRLYYKHDVSLIHNLFYPSPKNRNHFTKIRILNYLFDEAEVQSFKDYFIQFDRVFRTFEKAGYSEDVIIDELTILLEQKLIETSSLSSDIEEGMKVSNKEGIKITQSGIYYIKTLINTFNYLDLVLQDTPIFDQEFFDKLMDSFPTSDDKGKRDLRYRIRNVESFCEYLRSQEIRDHKDNEMNYSVKALDKNIVDGIMKGGLTNELTRIQKVVV